MENIFLLNIIVALKYSKLNKNQLLIFYLFTLNADYGYGNYDGGYGGGRSGARGKGTHFILCLFFV